MKSAMQDLKEDLLESIDSGTEALQEIEDSYIRNICVIMLKKVMTNVVKRIDEELLEMEKNQIQKTYNAGAKFGSEISSEDYYVQQFIDNTW